MYSFLTGVSLTTIPHIATSATRMLRLVERLRKSAGAGDFDFFSGINHFMAPDRQRSGAFSIPIHPDCETIVFALAQIFLQIFSPKTLHSGLEMSV